LRAEAEENTGSTLQEIERNNILRVFRETGGVISVTANRLGMPRTTLERHDEKLRISRSDL
jgi:ActR/RegA family two-component response regulator